VDRATAAGPRAGCRGRAPGPSAPLPGESHAQALPFLFAANGLGNSYNNLFVSGIHYPLLTANTAQLQGLGLSLNLTFDFMTSASISLAANTPMGPGNFNLKVVGQNGDANFPLIPNLSVLFGIPFYAAATTFGPVTGFHQFTDPIRL
jgi:hypothetical protein